MTKTWLVGYIIYIAQEPNDHCSLLMPSYWDNVCTKFCTNLRVLSFFCVDLAWNYPHLCLVIKQTCLVQQSASHVAIYTVSISSVRNEAFCGHKCLIL